MISCPICGRETAVIETRRASGGARRRRKCTDVTCTGRVTTIEIVVDRFNNAHELADGHAVLIPRRLIASLQRLIARLGGAP